MFAKDLHGTSLITIQPAHPKFSDISQILLDLQSIVGSPTMVNYTGFLLSVRLAIIGELLLFRSLNSLLLLTAYFVTSVVWLVMIEFG
jgi:hypothetical protein